MFSPIEVVSSEGPAALFDSLPNFDQARRSEGGREDQCVRRDELLGRGKRRKEEKGEGKRVS